MTQEKDYCYGIAIYQDKNGIGTAYARYLENEILEDKLIAKMPKDAKMMIAFRSFNPIMRYEKAMDIMKLAGFDIWHTGGGCTAYGMRIDCTIDPDDTGMGAIDIMVTSIHGSTHLNEGDGYMIGMYYEDGDFWEGKNQFQSVETLLSHFNIAKNYAHETATSWKQFDQIMRIWLDAPIEHLQDYKNAVNEYKLHSDVKFAESLGFTTEIDNGNDDIFEAYLPIKAVDSESAIGVIMNVTTDLYVVVFDGSTHGKWIEFTQYPMRDVLQMVANMEKVVDSIVETESAKLHLWKTLLETVSQEYDVIQRYL